MTHIDKYLENFHDIIENLHDDNVVIAGTHALKIHGLIVNREPGDLDLVIFNPNPWQLTYLDSVYARAVNNNAHPRYRGDGRPEDQRSIKFAEEDLETGAKLYLDILIENNASVPADLLLYKYGNELYKIQNIALNIAAKRSYCPGDRDEMSLYARRKDMQDFQALKNDNFNI